MDRCFNRVAVLGLGGVGELAATLLHAAGFEVLGLDVRPVSLPFPTRAVAADNPDGLTQALGGQEAVLSCLPWQLNAGVARVAAANSVRYFDLTEDVPTTRLTRELSQQAGVLMAPQCGLAPGLVGIVGAHLAAQFDVVRSIRLRVGALPQHPTGLLGYSFTWSPAGVVNEYLNDCEVIEDGKIKLVSSMEWLETIHVNGVPLEAFTTSGGLGTMCETFGGKVENLDYKSMRYPGHAALMNFFFHELLMRENRELAESILTHAKPPVDEDVVHMHVSVEGSVAGVLSRREFVRSWFPQVIEGRAWRAIAWTTASSAAGVIELVANGTLQDAGFLRQETIPFDKLLETKSGCRFA